MQQLPNRLKTGILKSTAFGTALSITLQLACCYASAYAATENAPSDETSQRGSFAKALGSRLHKRHRESVRNSARADLSTENVLLANGEDATSIAMGGLEAVPPSNISEEAKALEAAPAAQPSESGLEAMAPPAVSGAEAAVQDTAASAAGKPEATKETKNEPSKEETPQAAGASGEAVSPHAPASSEAPSSAETKAVAEAQTSVSPAAQSASGSELSSAGVAKVAMAATGQPELAPPPVSDDKLKLAAADPTTTTTTTTTTTSPSTILTGISMTDTGDPVEKITKDVIVKIFELERLNTYFFAEATKQSKWRPWRMLISEEAAAIGVAAGTLIAVEQSLRSLHTGYKFHTVQIGPQLVFAKIFRPPGKVVLEHAFVTALPGVWFAVFQECFELGQNYFTDWQTKQKGFDYKTTRLKAKELQDQIDGLLKAREAAVASQGLSPQVLEVEAAEAKVLHDLRDMAVQEYTDNYVQARKIRCNQNCFYLWDIAEKVTGVLSLQAGLQATRHGKLKNVEAFGVLQVVSAGLLELTPIVSQLYANYRGQKSREHVQQYVHGNPAVTPEVFEADRKHFQDVFVANGGSRSQALLNNLQARDAVYRSENETFYALNALTHRDKKEEARAFKHAMLVRSFASACKIAYGVQSGIILGDGRQTAPRKITELIFGGTVPYEVALDANIYDKFHEAIRTTKLENQLKAKGELRGQVYRSRLDRIDQAQRIVTPAH